MKAAYPTRTENAVLITIALLYATAFTVMVLAGCGTLAPGTGDHPSPYGGIMATGELRTPDRVLYDADVGIAVAYDACHRFVDWEYLNRSSLASTPEIKKAADRIRAGAPGWFKSAVAVRDAYAKNPNADNRTALQKALDVLQAAIAEANRYQTVQPIPAN